MQDGKSVPVMQGHSAVEKHAASDPHPLLTAVVQEPLVPAHISFATFPWLPLDIKMVTEGDVFYLSAEGFKAALLLMVKSWQETPAASLPDDPRKLANFAGLGIGRDALARWEAVKDEALSDFVLCSDGRFYSRALAPKAIEAWASKELQTARTAKAREARAANRNSGRETSTSATSSVTEITTEPVAQTATRSRREDRTSDQRTPEDSETDKKAPPRAKPVEVSAGGKGGVGGKRALRPQSAFHGVHITYSAPTVAKFAAEYHHLDDIVKALGKIDSEVGGMSDRDRQDAVRLKLQRLDEEARARAVEQDDDLPF